MKYIIASVFALSLVQVASAADLAPSKQPLSAIEKLVAKAAQPRASQNEVNSNATPACNPKGDSCYADDSWACCSGLCIDQTCQ